MKWSHCAFTCCCAQEGKQASLAADFSITQFKHLGRLLMVHGRNSYKRSAALSQFVIHRSLCISTMQVNGLSGGFCQWRGEKAKSKSNGSVFHFGGNCFFSWKFSWVGTWGCYFDMKTHKKVPGTGQTSAASPEAEQTIFALWKRCFHAACRRCQWGTLGNTGGLQQGDTLKASAEEAPLFSGVF